MSRFFAIVYPCQLEDCSLTQCVCGGWVRIILYCTKVRCYLFENSFFLLNEYEYYTHIHDGGDGCRSVFERALDVEYRNQTLWLKYAVRRIALTYIHTIIHTYSTCEVHSFQILIQEMRAYIFIHTF